ncbi:MAG: 16S rRNA processing protein RimM [Alphaproteobacteria bacterium]|nr:16S rRNA processing protein RimM [Alphaproteobacteria bacterium]MDE2111013.1 16S rRNA processing protein RimM [Alphaproteobacteria bacterium]MDE2493826.1 16S rRNA processing protein RimM [Alphaproteobacteria bacterium]
MPRDVLLAAIVGVHGLKGEVRVKTFTETPKNLGAYGPLHAADGRVFTLAGQRPGKDGEVVVAFREIANRNAAEALKGVELFVPRAALPPVAAGEFYRADLVGLTAEDALGRHIGKITAVHNYGASDVLTILRDDGTEVLIAFTRENVPEIDVKAGRLVVAVPEEVEAGNRSDLE